MAHRLYFTILACEPTEEPLFGLEITYHYEEWTDVLYLVYYKASIIYLDLLNSNILFVSQCT